MSVNNKAINEWAVRQPFNPKLSVKPNGKAVCYYRVWNAEGQDKQRKKTFGLAGDPQTIADFETWRNSLSSRPRTAADSLAGLLVEWIKYCRETYTDDRELNFCDVVARLLKPYAGLSLGEFRTSHVVDLRGKLVTQAQASGDRSRPYINKLVNAIGDLFQWAAERNLCGDVLAHTIGNIKPLTHKTAPGLRGKKVVVACQSEDVAAAINAANPTIAALLTVHRLTGMRPGEVATMSWDSIDTDGDVWTYTPKNKNGWRGEGFDRIVYLGARAQDALHNYQAIRPNPKGEYIFSPREAWALTEYAKQVKRFAGYDLSVFDQFKAGECTRAEAMLRLGVYHSTFRGWMKTDPRDKTAVYFYHRAPAKYKPFYDRYSLRTAYHNAAKAGGVDKFNPRQIRKLRAVEVDQLEGREAAAAQLGHAKIETTALYTFRNQRKALELAEKHG